MKAAGGMEVMCSEVKCSDSTRKNTMHSVGNTTGCIVYIASVIHRYI